LTTQSGAETTKVTSTKPSERPKTIITKKAKDLATPSISKALSGETKSEEANNSSENNGAVAEPESKLNNHFTENELHSLWPVFIERYTDQVHLYNSLKNMPKLENDYLVVISVENSVLQEKTRLMKPEIIGYLRRELKNDFIDVRVDLEERDESEVKIITDEQKLKAMMQKNPALVLFKNKFNLDYSG
jgi:hypothetical protein